MKNLVLVLVAAMLIGCPAPEGAAAKSTPPPAQPAQGEAGDLQLRIAEDFCVRHLEKERRVLGEVSEADRARIVAASKRYVALRVRAAKMSRSMTPPDGTTREDLIQGAAKTTFLDGLEDYALRDAPVSDELLRDSLAARGKDVAEARALREDVRKDLRK